MIQALIAAEKLLYCFAMSLFFKKDQFLGIRSIAYVLLAVSLMWLDHRSPVFHRARSSGEVIMTPIEYIVDAPGEFVHHASNDLATRHHLLAENTHLKAQNILLKSKLQSLTHLVHENQQLQDLLKSTANLPARFLEAQILKISPVAYLQEFILSRGSGDGVFVGQPVLDGHGVLGQVVQTDALTSRMILLTNPKVSIPVQVKRNGLRSMTIGDGRAGTLSLEGITATSDIKVGDELLTSGMGQRYPAGYPVGEVSNIIRTPGDQFLKVTLKPVAEINRTQLVLLVFPEKSVLAQDKSSKQETQQGGKK